MWSPNFFFLGLQSLRFDFSKINGFRISFFFIFEDRIEISEVYFLNSACNWNHFFKAQLISDFSSVKRFSSRFTLFSCFLSGYGKHWDLPRAHKLLGPTEAKFDQTEKLNSWHSDPIISTVIVFRKVKNKISGLGYILFFYFRKF